MTSYVPPSDLETMNPEDVLNLIVDVSTRAGLTAEIRRLSADDPNSEPHGVFLTFPDDGKGRRLFYRLGEDALSLASINFQKISFIQDLQAIFDSSSDSVEARISSLGDATSYRNIWRVPGSEILEAGEPQVANETLDEFDALLDDTSERPKKWRLRVSEGTQYVEISPIQNRTIFRSALSESLSIKLGGFNFTDLNHASEILQVVGNAFLFELDVVHGISLGIARFRAPFFARGPILAERAATFPKNAYSKEALTLYQYGRSARQLPLLQFLAYYQSLEYFFPSFTRSETVNKMRRALQDPRLNPTKDDDVNKLINISISEMRASQRERDQLRATIRGCASEDELKGFIESSKLYRDHFCSNNQSISKDMKITLEKSQSSIADQLADRIYKIRCRVVHTKQDGNGEEGELLLPFSPEVNSLKIDIELMRFLAQQALFSKASRK